MGAEQRDKRTNKFKEPMKRKGWELQRGSSYLKVFSVVQKQNVVHLKIISGALVSSGYTKRRLVVVCVESHHQIIGD